MRPQSGQFLHYNCNSLYYNEDVRTKKKNHVKCDNLPVEIFQTKKYIMLISLFTSELLQLKNPLKNKVSRFVGVLTIYVCAYYFLINKDI